MLLSNLNFYCNLKLSNIFFVYAYIYIGNKLIFNRIEVSFHITIEKNM